MSHHYDVEKSLEQLRAILASRPLPKDASDTARTVHRHREVTAAYLRLTLEEANRGTDFSVIIEAIAHLTAEAVVNTAKPLDDHGRALAVSYFLAELQRMLGHILASPADFSTPVTSEPGGHA